MKLAGDYIVFGEGALDYLETIKGKKAVIVMNGRVLKTNGVLDSIREKLKKAGIESTVVDGIEPEPSIQTVLRGAKVMQEYQPDWIVALGGGSSMDAAKAMWVFYEHPELKTLDDITPPNKIPKLRGKARMICIPSTSGTASEVSRSIVISDKEKHIKQGIGNMEMMPDIALLEPKVTASMPPKITAETGFDALTHAIEAYVSRRADDVTDTLSEKAILEIFKYLPLAYEHGDNLFYREKMQNFSMIAGLAFTNCSLGIVHSIAHSFGAVFNISHGLANGVVLPYVIRFNGQSEYARKKYDYIAGRVDKESLYEALVDLKKQLSIPVCMQEVIHDDAAFDRSLELIAQKSVADGCTKTSPVIPDLATMKELIGKVYYGES
jgi:alcohol dehydrogenase class IV